MVMVVLTVIIFGLISLRYLPRNLMPDIAYPSITVRTEYPGASPIDVETRVSRRLEEVLSQVRSLRRISSISRAEVSDVILEFDWKSEMDLAVMEIREKLEQAILPDDVARPTTLRYDPSLDPVLQIGLYRKASPGELADGHLIELRLLAEDILERELEREEGVAAVKVRGGLEREIHIQPSESQLRARGVSTALINQRLAAENLNQASGHLYEGDRAYVVRTVNEFQTIEEIESIILKHEGTVPVRLRDVATVSWSHEEPEILTRINGNPCVKIDIYKEADANIVEVARRVRDRVFGTREEQELLVEMRREERKLKASSPGELPPAAEKKPGWSGGTRPTKPTYLASLVPPGTALEVMSDQSVFIQNALGNVQRTAILGGVLAILVLLFFLRNPWFTMAVGLSIPISVIATFIAMYLFEVSLNMMSLGGLALGIGLLVDNSIVVLESIFRCREEGDPPRVAAVRGTQDVARAVVASTLTTVAVFCPIVFVEGVAGQVFRDQALTVVISLLVSLLTALYFIPACVGRSGMDRLPGAWSGSPSPFESIPLFERRLRALPWRWWNSPILAVWGIFLSVTMLCRILLGVASWCIVWVLRLILRTARALRGALGWLLSGNLRRAFGIWDSGFEGLRRAYERFLRLCLAHRKVVVGVAILSFCLTLRLLSQLGSELIPEVHQGEFTADIRLPVGTRIEKTNAVLRPLVARLLEQAGELGIDSVTTTVGVEKDSIQAGDQGEHTAQVLVRLKPAKNILQAEELARARFREILKSEVELKSSKFQNPVLFSFKTPIEVEVKGYDLEELKKVTRAIEKLMRENSSLRDVKSNVASGFPEVQLRFDREQLANFNLSVGSVGAVIREKIQGDVPTYFNEGDRKIGLRVRLEERDRETVGDLMNLIVNPGNPNPVRLQDVATEIRREGPAEIRRINQQRAGVVSANMIGMDLGRLTREVEEAIREVPRSVRFQVGFGGQKEEMDQSLDSLKEALLLAIFLVYVVMAIQFESLIQPLVIILAVPLAMVGVVPVLWWLGLSLNIVVFIGLIVLAGIVVNNAIVLLDCVNGLRRQGVPPEEALVRAGSMRFRPILMTTLTTVLGLLPLTGWLGGVEALEWILGTGEGAEIRMPLAITVIAGLSVSTLLTLVVVPVVDSLVVGIAGRGALGAEENRG